MLSFRVERGPRGAAIVGAHEILFRWAVPYTPAGVRYELLLQSAEPGAPFDPAPVEAALVAHGYAAGEPSWKLSNGNVEVQPLLEGGKQVAVELRIPLSDRLELIREAVTVAAEVASEAGARLVDLQLSRAVGAHDAEAVADQYFRTAQYAGEMMGVSEAVMASFAPEPEGMSRTVKVMLGLGAFLLVLYLVAEHLVAAL